MLGSSLIKNIIPAAIRGASHYSTKATYSWLLISSNHCLEHSGITLNNYTGTAIALTETHLAQLDNMSGEITFHSGHTCLELKSIGAETMTSIYRSHSMDEQAAIHLSGKGAVIAPEWWE